MKRRTEYGMAACPASKKLLLSLQLLQLLSLRLFQFLLVVHLNVVEVLAGDLEPGFASSEVVQKRQQDDSECNWAGPIHVLRIDRVHGWKGGPDETPDQKANGPQVDREAPFSESEWTVLRMFVLEFANCNQDNRNDI